MTDLFGNPPAGWSTGFRAGQLCGQLYQRGGLPPAHYGSSDTDTIVSTWPTRHHCTSCAQVIKRGKTCRLLVTLAKGRSHCSQPAIALPPLMELCTGAVSIVIFVHLTAEFRWPTSLGF